jgi:aspartate aminotransferase-like enzyme
VSKSNKPNLRIPGPTTLFPIVRKIMGGEAFNHRGPRFEEILSETSEKLKEVFHTKEDVFVLTTSGTGGLEAAIVNTLSPMDKVISVSIGTFGDRFSEIAKSYGANVIDLKYIYGTFAEPEDIKKVLLKHPDTKAVLITHNETSTGVTNDLKTIAQIVKANSQALLIVDGVSSVAAIPLNTDEWKCDVVVTASQKGFGVPPGLAMLSFNKKAWDAYNKSKMPKFYFDLGKAKKSLEKKQTPFTPAIHQIEALNAGLDIMLRETLPVTIKRHLNTMHKVRKEIRKMGFELLADDDHASSVLTSVKSDKSAEIVKDMRKKGVEIAGGYGPLAGKIFRIGHLGHFTVKEITHTLKTIKEVASKIK